MIETHKSRKLSPTPINRLNEVRKTRQRSTKSLNRGLLIAKLANSLKFKSEAKLRKTLKQSGAKTKHLRSVKIFRSKVFDGNGGLTNSLYL